MANTHNGLVIEFEDRYGEKRVVHGGRHGLQLKRMTTTVTLALNRTAARLMGEKIRAERQAAGLSLADLCKRAGLVSATPKQRMWEIENSVRKEGVRLGTLYALAVALDVPVAALLPTRDEVLEACDVDFVQPDPRLAVDA